MGRDNLLSLLLAEKEFLSSSVRHPIGEEACYPPGGKEFLDGTMVKAHTTIGRFIEDGTSE
jgi:hypothetical protein